MLYAEIKNNTEDLWEAILSALDRREAYISEIGVEIKTSNIGWGRTKLAAYVQGQYVAFIVFNGTQDEGIDLTRVTIKLYGDRNDERRMFEKLIRLSKFIDNKREPKVGGYDIEKPESLAKSVIISKKRNGCDVLPFVRANIGMLRDGERIGHRDRDLDDELCDDYDN